MAQVKGISLYSADSFSVVPVSKFPRVEHNGRGWAYIHTKIAAHAADTATVTISGRLNASAAFVVLKKYDNTAALSVAQVAGALTEQIDTVQLMPEMKVVLSGTSTAGALVSVWLEASLAAARTDS